MPATLRLPRLGLLNVIEGLVAFHPAARFGVLRTSNAEWRAEETLALLPPHLREDAGLPLLPPPEPEHPAITTARSRGRNWG